MTLVEDAVLRACMELGSPDDPADMKTARAVISAYLTEKGWKLVPVEPTEAMIDAGIEERAGQHGATAEIYRAMLAAAPSPPSQE